MATVFLLYKQNSFDYDDYNYELVGIFSNMEAAIKRAEYPLLDGPWGEDGNGRNRYYYSYTCWIEEWKVENG